MSSTPRKYFHDRLVLLMLSVGAFLTIACAVLVLLRVETDQSAGYIVQYRSNLGLNSYTNGTTTDLYSFIVFSVFVFAFHVFLSFKTYHIRRYFSLAILGTGLLLLILSILVSNALLIL